MLDTNVLLSADARILFSAIARQGAFVPLWSDITSDELHANLRDAFIRGGLPRPLADERARVGREDWNRAHPEAETMTRNMSVRTKGMAHEKDQHVLAAALIRRADAIITRDRTAFTSPTFPPDVHVANDAIFLRTIAEMQPRPFARALLDVDAQLARRGDDRSASDLITVIEEENRRSRPDRRDPTRAPVRSEPTRHAKPQTVVSRATDRIGPRRGSRADLDR